jgi:hypothetical protein
LAAAIAACAALAAPGSASAVSFGIADAPSICGSWGSTSCTSWSYGFASYALGSAGSRTAFTTLKSGLPLRYVRLSVPYDAVYDADPSTGQCRWSYDYTSHTSSAAPSGGGPGSAWYRLSQELRDAQAAGLTPVVTLSNATGDGQQQDGNPATPDMTAASASGPDAVTTLAGKDYTCGVSGITYLTHANGLPVGEWEAWNEPDGAPAYNGALVNACGSLPNNCGGIYDQGTGLCGSTTYTQCGPLEAAHMYAALVAALTQLNTNYGWAIPRAAAGTFAWPSVGYFNAYYHQLTAVVGQWPAFWSYHDYADVTSGQYAQSLAFTKALYNHYATAGKPQPTAWITESGSVLTDGDTSYNSQSVTCSNGEDDDAGRLGACVDGSATGQQSSANAFLNLATAGSYWPGQITEVFWFQLQPTNASTGWDSGLLAPPRAPSGSWSQLSPDGVYGSINSNSGLRPGYCVLARLSSASCSSSRVVASDWSVQPRTVTASLSKGQTTATIVGGDQSSLANGDFVTGSGIHADTTISSGAGTSAWVLSKAATTTGTVSLTASG